MARWLGQGRAHAFCDGHCLRQGRRRRALAMQAWQRRRKRVAARCCVGKADPSPGLGPGKLNGVDRFPQLGQHPLGQRGSGPAGDRGVGIGERVECRGYTTADVEFGRTAAPPVRVPELDLHDSLQPRNHGQDGRGTSTEQLAIVRGLGVQMGCQQRSSMSARSTSGALLALHQPRAASASPARRSPDLRRPVGQRSWLALRR